MGSRSVADCLPLFALYRHFHLKLLLVGVWRVYFAGGARATSMAAPVGVTYSFIRCSMTRSYGEDQRGVRRRANMTTNSCLGYRGVGLCWPSRGNNNCRSCVMDHGTAFVAGVLSSKQRCHNRRQCIERRTTIPLVFAPGRPVGGGRRGRGEMTNILCLCFLALNTTLHAWRSKGASCSCVTCSHVSVSYLPVCTLWYIPSSLLPCLLPCKPSNFLY